MTLEEKSRKYADAMLCGSSADVFFNSVQSEMDARNKRLFNCYDIEQAYEDGATETLASQWKDPKVELPESAHSVLVKCKIAPCSFVGERNKDDLSYTVASCFRKRWSFLDEYFKECEVLAWMPIPPVKGGEA